MPATDDLTDLSFLIFADLGVQPTRTQARINSLTNGLQGNNQTNAPVCLRALVDAGFITHRPTANGYKVEITDKGLALHRQCMALMRQAASL